MVRPLPQSGVVVAAQVKRITVRRPLDQDASASLAAVGKLLTICGAALVRAPANSKFADRGVPDPDCCPLGGRVFEHKDPAPSNKRLHLTRAPYGDVALDCR